MAEDTRPPLPKSSLADPVTQQKPETAATRPPDMRLPEEPTTVLQDTQPSHQRNVRRKD